jgi:hypothetical protein
MKSASIQPPVGYARLAGFLYLTIAVFGAFSIGYVPSVIVVTGDAAATANNLLTNIGLFRLGILADLIVLVSEIVLTVMLYMLLRPISQTLSWIAAFARFSMVFVMAINILLNLLPIILLSGPGFQNGLGSEQAQSLALLFFEAHQYGVDLWGLLFGLHLLILGYLVTKSGYFPRFLGWMMAIGSMGYMVEGATKVTFTESPAISVAFVLLLTFATLGEISFAIWLSVKGLKLPEWQTTIRQNTAVEQGILS